MVRAKFTVDSIERTVDWRDRTKELHNVKLSPVHGSSPENAEFYAATPSGKIELNCVAEAAQQFQLGKTYFVDFSLAE